jgi:hypothetical protein
MIGWLQSVNSGTGERVQHALGEATADVSVFRTLTRSLLPQAGFVTSNTITARDMTNVAEYKAPRKISEWIFRVGPTSDRDAIVAAGLKPVPGESRLIVETTVRLPSCTHT